MTPGSLAVITVDPDLRGCSTVERVLADWEQLDSPPLPPVAELTAEQTIADESIMDGCAAAWVLATDQQEDELYEVLAVLHERQIPTVLSTPDATATPGETVDESAVAAPLQAPSDTTLTILRTVLAQSVHVRALKTEVKLMQLRQGGLAHQIEQIDEEMRIAALLQREFVPDDLEPVHGVRFNSLFRPAGYVSGDIYDLVQLDEDHVGVFIADAVGHGVPAALMTIVIKRALVTSVPDPGLPSGKRIVPPNEALFRLNNEMARQASNRRGFPSACYAVVNCRTRRVSLARAGHPFAMVVNPNGTCRWIKPQGTLLGIFPNQQYELADWTLEPGERLLIYSDGFEQAFPTPERDASAATSNESFEYGYAAEFLDLANGPPVQAIQRLCTKLDEQAGSLNQDDDLTVICVSTECEPPATATKQNATATDAS